MDRIIKLAITLIFTYYSYMYIKSLLIERKVRP